MKFFIEYEFWKYMFQWMKFDFLFFVLFFEWCIYERMKFFMKEWIFFIKSEFWIWMKMHVWIHKIWFFILFEEFIYECMKVWLNMNFWFEWKWMFEYMKFDFFYSSWRMHLRMCEIFVNFMNENACLNAWVLFTFLILFFFFKNTWNFVNSLNENACLNGWVLFVFLILFFYFKNAFMNAWNFVNFLNESACLNTLILFVFLILFFFLTKECIYECIKLDFFILLFLKNAYMNAWNLIFFCFVIFE